MHEIVILIAKYLIVVSGLLTVYCFVRVQPDQRKRFVLEAIIGAVLAVVLAKIGSKLFNNPRPFVAGHFTPYFSHGADNGFPSDHTLLSSFLGYLVLKYDKTLGWILLGCAAAIGLARVRAGVHHLIDIIGSFVFAGLAILITRWVVTRALKKAA